MNTIKINITKDPNYGFSNLEFSEKPTTEMLQELKNNGWRYSSHFKRWYPATEEAKKNAESFAQDYYRHYTSEEQTKTIKTAESLVDLNSIENSVDAYISEYENEMKKGNYNAFVEVQEFIKKNSFITPKAKSYINRFIHSINDIKGVTAFVAYGKDFYTYDEGIKLISELNSKIEKYKSIKNNPAQNEYSDLLNMIKDELKMIDNSRNKGTLYSVLQKEGDSYEQKIRRSNERNNGDGRTDYSGESGNSLGNKVEEQRSVHNSDKISDPAGHSDSKMHDGLDSGRSTELEANGTSADIQRQRLQSNALEQEKLSETDKVNDSTRDAGNGTQNLSEGRVEVYSAERKGSIGAVGNGLNKYGEIQRKIYSYESFGYEGALVTVETDLRRGIPAIDIVGLADSAVKESRERVRAAFKNSGLEFPAERVLMSLSPADLKKDSAAHDLAIALSVLNEKYGYKGEPVLALGELELSGKLRPVRSVYAAVENAIKEGIRNIIVPKQNVEEVLAIPGVNVLGVSSLEEAHEKLINNEPFVTKETFVEPAKELGIKFNEELLSEAMNTNLEGYYDTARAIEIAIAGKHNILLEGAPGCGKTLLTQHLIPGLTPNLTNEEAQTTTRIWSIAGLLKPTEGLKKDVPFRMPHQTASIEGICGGGTKVNPGEISLAHNGVLFLDEAAEFRSSVLQMLRVPLETHSIALSRAGRTTVYPANFQLVMATNPCPCGNYGVEGKICLCSEKSREMYWKKFSDPLLDRIDIKQHVEKNEKDSREISAAEMKAHIENAFRIQRKNPHYNASLAPEEIAKLCSLNGECKKYFDEHTKEMSERSKAKMLKLALTIANMDNRTEIALDDLKEARELNSPLFEKPNEFRKEPVYEAVAKKSKQIAKETKTYSFFVKDTAEFEQFAEFDPITNLSAKEAVETMLAQEMIELSAGIGIHIPGDSVFNDPDGMGAIVFNKFNGQYSFYMGESFVKELKDNNEHAKNVIAAFKELDEAIKHSRIKPELYKEPDFVYEKEKEINGVEKLDAYNINGETYTKTNIEELLYEDINAIFHELDSGEMEQNLTLEAVKVYRNPEQDGKISLLVQYDSKNPENKWREDSLFDALKEENITFNGMEVDVNPITAEKSGTIEEYLQKLEGFEREEDLIKENAEKLEKKDVNIEEENIINAYNINTEVLYNRVIEKLEADGYVCRTQLELGKYRTPSFSELQEEIKKSSDNKFNPVIVPFDEYRDYNKSKNEYRTIKAWQIYDKESLKNGDYFTLGKCRINYLNDNLEIEIKNEHSGLSSKSYYNSTGTREICHILKEADKKSEEYKNAVEQVADYFVKQNIFDSKSILIPAPQHTGKAEYTYNIAASISRKTHSSIADVLKCKPHETLYEQKKNGKEPDVEFYLENADESTMQFWKEKGYKVYLIDNNISTGLTFNRAEELIPGLIPAPYAIGNFAEFSMKDNRYVINNLLEDNSVKHENGYVLTKSGSKDFGEITPEIASEIHRESGKIRLETGSHDNDGRGYGEVHIERDERLKQLKQNGFENARDFIEYVTDDFDAIYEGINNTLVIVKRDEKANLAYLSLRQNEIDKEIFYTVESALISRQNYLKENKLLWTNPNSSYKKEQERAQSNHLNETPSAISGNSFDKLNIIHENNSVNEINEIKLKKDIKAIREQCREILKKPDSEITNEDKLILAQYEGAGGLNEENRTISGILNEFYTPNNLVEKVWQVVDTYAPEAKTVLEPSAGVGKFANNRPNNTFTMHELDETSARINKILHPEANVIQGAYQKQFFDAGERIHIPQQKAKYDVVIGNPPYGAYNDKYKGLGEGKEFDRYEEYFISKGLDALKDENSVMAYVVPSGFLNTASDKQKEILASKGKLIDAYRLPVGVFPTTEVGTDIIIMQSWEKERKDLQKHWDSQGRFLTIDEAIKAEQKGHVDLLSNGEWFRQHPEKILGEIKKRTNRFGKEEEYVAVHEGLTIQDELNKIEDLLPDTNKTQITQQAETVSNEKEQKPVTLSIEELSLAKSVIPEQQFITTLSLSKGEEGDFFKQKIKDIANAVSKAPKLYETDGAEQHALLFRYFHPAGTESLVCEIGEDGEAFGFQCINGDYINAEWGYIDLNELKKNPEMQLDYHVPKGMSIERWLYKEQPDMYPDYAKFAEQSEKTPFDIAKETGNDVEAVANAMNEQTPSEKVHSETVGESVDDKSLREYDDPDGLFKTPKILSMQEFSKFYTGNNFDEKDYNIWANTDYRGIVNTASLSAEEKEYLKTSGKYVEPEPGIYTNAMLYATGKIYEKLDELEKQKENLSSESYEKCKSILEKAVPELYPMSKIQMDVLSPLAEEFTVTRTVTRKQWDYGAIKNVTSDENLNLKEDFLSWCTGYLQPDSENTRTYIQDFSVANVSREEIPENISFNDIAAYVDRIPVNTGISEDDTKEERNAKLTVAGAKKDARKETAYKLFNRYLQTGLSAEEKEQFCLFWNKIYNGTVQADYKKLPLFIDGMSTYKGREPFKLYKQQIEGINRLVSKGNGLLAYGVGVGKTAAGICASIAQMQSKRAKRPLIICPDQVYEKWVRDLRELFPNVTINELGNLSDPFLEANHYDEATHSLIIPENSVSVMIDSALQKITFTDEACNEYLAKDFGCVLGLSAELESGDDRDRANALQKIQNLVGKASRIKTVKVPGDNIARETEIQQSYVFFDRCNWDNICVDEAHKYKNLFVIPRAKKGDKKQANEFEGIGSAAQSRRALKMFGMTTIIQQQNENRNVFLLTATPFTNNPLEVYSMLSFMARKELLDRHIYDVRDFCTEFALTKNEYAVTPDGDIKPKNVMKAFKGQKKLRSLITEFIDSKSAEDAGIPKPEGERHAVFLELTDLQQAIINYNEAAIKNASGKDGVVLRAMTHMRTATLSPALLDSDDYPGLDIPPLEKVVECSPKLKYECDTVADVYKHKPECGQFIYMPQGVESFQYVKEYLIKQGVPEEAIEYVSGKHNNTNKKKQKVADRFNDKEDKLKVLIGSSNVAEGIDLNGNSICCYNTMLGWNPTESVQVEGRIWRQGNEQGKVHIYYPLMEDSIDALIYQKHDEKASRINSIFKENENDQDTIDVSEIDPETVKFELIKDPVKKVDMLIEQDTAEFKKELKILENRTETINDLVKAYGIIKNMITEQKSEHEKYSELVKQYRENLKNIPENDSTRWQHEGKLEAAVHTRDVAYKELQKGNARMNSIMTNFMRMDIKVPETEAAIKLEEIARKKQAVLEKIESIEKSKDKRIEEEQIKLLQKKLVAKPLEQQRKETVEYILKNTWYKTTEEKVEPEKPVVKDASITTEPITSIPIELEERFNEALEKKDFKVLSQFCCWGDRNSIKEYSENNAAIKIFCDQFEKKYNIGLPSDIGDRFITLVNFCDPETLPEEYKFKDLEEAISYELKDLNSGTENSSKRIKEFYEKKPNVNEFANFLKEEYGTGGHSFIGYDHWHDAKGIKLTALINGKKESKLYSWNEIASRMSKIIEKSRPRVDFEIMSEEKRKSFDSFQQQDLFGFEELNPSKVLEYGEYDEIGFISKFINANKGLLPVIKEKEDVYKVYCKGKDICNYESSKDIYIHDADDVEISVSKKLLQNVARQYIQNKVIENIKSEYEDGNFKKKKIAVPKLSEITETQKDVFIKNGIDDENEMLKMYRETYKDVLLSGEKPILVAKKQDSSVSVKDSRTVTKEATYIINDENIGY